MWFLLKRILQVIAKFLIEALIKILKRWLKRRR